jgi:hypothetical protein
MLLTTSKKTLGVNGAFLQEIKDSNPDLAHALHAVRATCHELESPADTAKQLVRMLDDLRDCLAFQFALEETYGYVEGAVETNAADAVDAGRAREQHCSLYLDISELCEQAEELQYRGFAAEHVRELIDETLKFHARLIAHERLEADLVDRAYRAQRRSNP